MPGLVIAGFRKIPPFDEYLKRDHLWLGRVVELAGNRVTLDGCQFDLSSPLISRLYKGRLLVGRYEVPERSAIQTYMDPDLPVVELGGSIGVVACLTNRRLTRPERHVVVEAHADLLPILEHNRRLNGCGFVVLHRAIAYGAEAVPFFTGADFLQGSVGRRLERVVDVPTVNLQAILDKHGFERATLICDIEGGESDLVQHEADILAERIETLIAEVHPGIIGPAAIEALIQRLQEVGFRVVRNKDKVLVLQNATGWRSQHTHKPLPVAPASVQTWPGRSGSGRPADTRKDHGPGRP